MIGGITKTAMESIECNPMSGSSISTLLRGGAPLAIKLPTSLSAFFTFATGIIFLIVDTINAHFGRPISHCFKKVFEFLKAFTNANASTSPVFVLVVINIVAPIFHFRPTVIGACHPSLNGVPMLKESGTRQRWYSAPTRLRYFVTDGPSKNFDYLSTFTLTEVINAWNSRYDSGRCLAENFSLPKRLTDERYLSGHDVTFFKCFNVVSSGGHSAQTDDRCAILLKFLQECKLHGGPIQCLASSGFGAKLLLKGIYG